MKVQRLVMNSFGNQQDKIIDFSDGVNLIMGTDEDTLQTVRSFIDGMLFGLSPENKKRYNPGLHEFSGTIYLEDESGRSIKVERDFINDQYRVTTADGDDITADYSDEYGNLALLPVSDSIFAGEVLQKPETSEKSLKKLSELKNKRAQHISKYDYDAMLKEREVLLKDINAQREIEDQLEQNTAEINEKENRIAELNDIESVEFFEINENIAALERENLELIKKIREIREEESQKQGEGLLKRNIQGADDQIDLIDRRIRELTEEEDSYQSKLSKLEESFSVDREELKKDYELYHETVKRQRGENNEPLAEKLASQKSWIYTLLILLGICGVGVALYNPEDVLGRVVIFLICFVSLLMILISAFALYLRTKDSKELELSEENIEELDEGRLSEIFLKYNQQNEEAFNTFYNSAKKIYMRMDSLKSDLTDIRRELGLAQSERERVLSEKSEAQSELEKDEKFTSTYAEEQIEEMIRKQKANLAKIDELKEEREKASQNSVWKLKEQTMALEENNAELKRRSSANEKMVEDFTKLQRRIDRYESKLNDYDRSIKEIEDYLKSTKEDFFLSYASPDTVDYDQKMARQFGFGLQKNLSQGIDVPFITYNPLDTAGSEDARLIEKLKRFIKDKQVLIFSSSLDEQIALTRHQIKHNGIFIAERKVG